MHIQPRNCHTAHVAMPATRFGTTTSMPLDVRIHRNPVWSRLFIESSGFYLWSILLARNSFERLEKAGDLASWLTIGILAPLALEKLFNGVYTKHLKQRFAFSLNKPLALPFELLDKAALRNTKQLQGLAKHLGTKSLKALPKLAHAILLGKLAIVGLDLLLMASKGQLYFWGKNWLTEHLSGKKGFSGEFDYTSEAFREKSSKRYKETKQKNLWLSLGIGYGAALALPLALWALLKCPVKPAKTILSLKGSPLAKLKSMIPMLNYTDAIYMSKWVILWHCFFNWNLPGLFSARDKHERREHITRSVLFDFFYFIGDDIFAGLGAKWLQKRFKPSIPIINTKRVAGVHIPVAIPAHKLLSQVQGNTGHLAFKLARKAAWIGILGTALCLGIGTTLANNWYTKQTVLREQATNNKPHTQASSPKKASKPKKVFSIPVNNTPQSVFPQYYAYPTYTYWSHPSLPYNTYSWAHNYPSPVYPSISYIA